MKNKENKNLKEGHITPHNTHYSGITLIALVVTIVVLLILAGITINFVFGDNGILKIAKEAGDRTNRAVEDELNQLNYISDWLQGKVTATSKKTPIKIGEGIVAVDIEIIVNGLEADKVLTQEEAVQDVQNMLKGKTTAEKEAMLEECLRYAVENGEDLPCAPTIEAFYEYNEVSSLEELALLRGITQEHAETFGFESVEDFLVLQNVLGSSPYYKVDFENGTIIKKSNDYEIIPPEGLEGEGNDYLVKENGEYTFIVKVLKTGEEIPVKVPVNEINVVYGTEYEAVASEDEYSLALKSKQTEKLETFEEAWVVLGGHSVDWNERIYFRSDVSEWEWAEVGVTGDYEFSVVMADVRDLKGAFREAYQENVPVYNGMEVNVLIKKNGAFYLGTIKFVRLE